MSNGEKLIPNANAWELFVKHYAGDDPVEKADLLGLHPDDRRILFEQFMKSKGYYKKIPTSPAFISPPHPVSMGKRIPERGFNLIPNIIPHISPDLDPHVSPHLNPHVIPHVVPNIAPNWNETSGDQLVLGEGTYPLSGEEIKQSEACVRAKKVTNIGNWMVENGVNGGPVKVSPLGIVSGLAGAIGDVAGCLDDTYIQRIKENIMSFEPIREWTCQRLGVKKYCKTKK